MFPVWPKNSKHSSDSTLYHKIPPTNQFLSDGKSILAGFGKCWYSFLLIGLDSEKGHNFLDKNNTKVRNQ